MEMVGRKLCVRLVCFFLAFFLVVSWVNKLHAASPTYPDRPINLVTPYNPGGMMGCERAYIGGGHGEAFKAASGHSKQTWRGGNHCG